MVSEIGTGLEIFISSATPRFSKWRWHSGEMNSPHSFGRGNFFCSTSRTRRPLRARRIAALEPAGPAPAMITSKLRVFSIVPAEVGRLFGVRRLDAALEFDQA